MIFGDHQPTKAAAAYRGSHGNKAKPRRIKRGFCLPSCILCAKCRLQASKGTCCDKVLNFGTNTRHRWQTSQNSHISAHFDRPQTAPPRQKPPTGKGRKPPNRQPTPFLRSFYAHTHNKRRQNELQPPRIAVYASIFNKKPPIACVWVNFDYVLKTIANAVDKWQIDEKARRWPFCAIPPSRHRAARRPPGFGRGAYNFLR